MATFTATYSPEDNKIRLYASSRLDAETYERVKAAGFSWAPKQELFVAPKWSPAREDLATELAGEIEAEEMTMVERAAIKAERLDALAHKRRGDAEALSRRADDLSQAFYMGQPILIGHHSERKARKTQERMNAAQANANKAEKAANYWLYRAEGVEAHANYKNNPRVRANRIKTLLAELRDLQREINRANKALETWAKLTTDDLIRHALGRLPYEVTAASWSTYSDVESGKLSPQDARAQCIARAELTINGPNRKRWIDHTLNRLAYERSLLGPVARFSGELTPVILQAFAREHGAEKPAVTVADDGFFLLESPVPLPAHLADGRFMEMSDDEWRDVMQACGYEVPAKKDAAPPILNLDVPHLQAKSRASYRGAPTVETVRVARVTREQYSKIGTDYRGTRLSACGTFRFKVASARQLGVALEGEQWAFVGVFLTDQKAHPLPEALQSVEQAA